MIQQALVIALVALAIVFLGRIFYKKFSRKDGCDGCAISKASEKH